MNIVTGNVVTSPVQRIAYNIEEAALASGLGRTTLYKMIGNGLLGSVKIGNRRLIPASALERLIATNCHGC